MFAGFMQTKWLGDVKTGYIDLNNLNTTDNGVTYKNMYNSNRFPSIHTDSINCISYKVQPCESQ